MTSWHACCPQPTCRSARLRCTTSAAMRSSPSPRWRIEAVWMAETLRQVIIYPGEDGFWVAECPSLPGCISQGQTRTEAITNIREAIEAYVAVLEEDGL